MKLPDIRSAFPTANRSRNQILAAALIIGIALFEWFVKPDMSMGFLYLFPILIAAGFLSRRQIFLVAALCTVLREALGRFPWDGAVVVRTVLGFLSFLGVGLFVAELTRRRQSAVAHLRQIEKQTKLREEAEAELRVLVSGSPAAILTADERGEILVANEAAHRLFAINQDSSLVGQPIGAYLPPLASVHMAGRSGQPMRTMLESRGRRSNGEVFLAHIWLSTYVTHTGPRLAAIVMDASENLRDREELGLRQLLTSSRIMVSAVSHEIRNICAAIAVVRANLARIPQLEKSEDFKALGTLVEGLEKLASPAAHYSPSSSLSRVDLHEVLDELRILIEPSFQEIDGTVRFDILEELPQIWADRQGLIQVSMNLARNSQRAIESAENRELRIVTSLERDRVFVRFYDMGTGVSIPEELFKPFQQGADGTGLGLYVSRAMLRTFGGELRHIAQPQGCCFEIELARAFHEETTAS